MVRLGQVPRYVANAEITHLDIAVRVGAHSATARPRRVARILRRVALAAIPALLLALPSVPAAYGHGDGPARDVAPIGATREVREVDGEKVTVDTHADPVAAFSSLTSAVPDPGAAPATSAATAPALPATWCGDVKSRDDVDYEGSRSDPKVKVVEAYPSDRVPAAGSRDRIQAVIGGILGHVGAESGQRKSLRFDLGTRCGARYVDILTLRLPRPTSEYEEPCSTAGPLFRDVRAALRLDQLRNVIIFAPEIDCGAIAGYAEAPADDQPGPGNRANRGGYMGVTFYENIGTALHEIGHNLGAVGLKAPHSDGTRHCWDQSDIMCYPYTTSLPGSPARPCATTSPEPWDCNKDDYFNPDPPAGSYLANNWNTYNSVFMCPVGQCVPNPPGTTITSGPDGVTSERNPSFSFSMDADVSFECKLDGPGTSGSYAPCSSPQGYSDLADGSYTFSVKAKDATGADASAPASREFGVDTTPPATTISSGPSGTTNSSSASFTFSSTEAGSTFECKLDAGAWIGCSSPKELTGLSDGPHAFSVKATDAAGNIDASGATRTWAVDTASTASPGTAPTGTAPTGTAPTPGLIPQMPGTLPMPAQIAAALGADVSSVARDLRQLGIAKMVRRRGFTARGLDALLAGRFSMTVAGTPRGSQVARKVVLARGSRSVSAAGRHVLRVKLTPLGSRLLRSDQRAQVALSITFRDIYGRTTAKSKSLRLRR